MIETEINHPTTEGIANLSLDSAGESSTADASTASRANSPVPNVDKVYPAIAVGIHSKDRDVRLKAVDDLRDYLGLEAHNESMNKVVQPIIMLNILPAIIEMLYSNDPEVVPKVTPILCNVAAGSSEQASAIVDAGVLPKLLELYYACSWEIKFDVLMVFGNVVSDSEGLRKIAIEQGACQAAIDVLRRPAEHEPRLPELAAWVVKSATTTENGGLTDDDLALELIDVLAAFIAKLISSDNNTDIFETLTDAAHAFYRLSVHRDVSEAIIKHGVVRGIVLLCKADDDTLREVGVRLVMHMSGKGEECVRELIEAECLDALYYCIERHPKTHALVCFAAANIANSSSLYVEALIDSSLFSSVSELASNDRWDEEDIGRVHAMKVILALARSASRYPELMDSLIVADYFGERSYALL
ncbi:Importin alpha subunit (Karyopherin alpha subunit) (Serine-rich RNA polymerase I suppressor protein), partial [Tulasnella sp. 427]